MIFLDTNVLSEAMKPRPDRRVLAWIERNGPTLQASTIALAEIAFGIRKVRKPERSPRWEKALIEWRRQLGANIRPFDDESAEIYGDIMGSSHLKGFVLAPLDGMIAATAIRHRGALATRNTKHFQFEGLTVIDPWTD